jgi:hypothetical protein
MTAALAPTHAQAAPRLKMLVVHYDGDPEPSVEKADESISRIVGRVKVSNRCRDDYKYLEIETDRLKASGRSAAQLKKDWNDNQALALLADRFGHDQGVQKARSWIYIGNRGEAWASPADPRIWLDIRDTSSVLAGYALLLQLEQHACPETVRAFAGVLEQAIKDAAAKGGSAKMLRPVRSEIQRIQKDSIAAAR